MFLLCSAVARVRHPTSCACLFLLSRPAVFVARRRCLLWSDDDRCRVSQNASQTYVGPNPAQPLSRADASGPAAWLSCVSDLFFRVHGSSLVHAPLPVISRRDSTRLFCCTSAVRCRQRTFLIHSASFQRLSATGFCTSTLLSSALCVHASWLCFHGSVVVFAAQNTSACKETSSRAVLFSRVGTEL